MTTKLSLIEQLREAWEARLTKAGLAPVALSHHVSLDAHSPEFKDIVLRASASSSREYYRRAGIFLHNHAFRSDLGKRIWEQHAEGVKPSGIAKMLGTTLVKVRSQVKYYRRKMLSYNFDSLDEWSGDACAQLDGGHTDE